MARSTVAVVMSNFNHARYLEESLGGICAQTRPADEIFVIDDASSDHSVSIIEKYAGQYPTIRFLRNETRLGVQGAISRVLPLVQADYLVWTSADDRLLPDFLQKSMAVLERHPQAGLCFSETAELKGDSGVVVRFAAEPSVAHIFDLADLPEYMARRDIERRMKRAYLPIAANTVVVRRDALQALGSYPHQLEWHADYLAYYAIALKHGACAVPETLALIRATPGSYSQAMREPARQRAVLAAMLDLLARHPYRDIRKAFRRCPSNFSPWGTQMLKLLLRRPGDWDLLVPYLAWKVREYKRGNGLTWWQAVHSLSRRLSRSVRWRVANRLASGLAHEGSPAPVAEFSPSLPELSPLVAELSHLRGRLKASAAIRDQIETQLNASDVTLAGFSNEHRAVVKELEEIKTRADQERESLAKDLEAAKREAVEMRVDRDSLTKDLEAAKREAAEMRVDRDSLAGELQVVKSDYASIKNIADEYRKGLEASRLPPLLFTTMPKSGTYYISKLFGDGLFIGKRIVSHQYFPDDVIRQPELRVLSRGNCISQDHFGASRINLTHIGRHVDRMIVHLRDPRQAMLSYVHYLDDERFRKNEQETRLFIYPPLPEDFYELEISSRIDWAIESWLPLLVQWVEGWVEAAEKQARPDIKFTRFEDMVANRDAFVSEVLAYFGIPRERFFEPNIVEDPEIHFRKGETDEWRRVFNAAQSAAASARIPAALASRFGWPMDGA